VKPHVASLAALLVLPGLVTGCLFLPSDLLSSFVLNPETTCQDLVARLRLGSLPDASTPTDIGLQFESVTVQSANGQWLSAWFVPAQEDGQLDPNAAGTVLLMHGTDGSQACTLPWVLVGASNHMHVVTFDYQGYGESGGRPDIATQLDDSEALLNWILGDDAPARQRVHLLGTSLGTGPALGLATLRTKPQIQSVALDGAYDPVAMVEAMQPYLHPIIFPLASLSARLGFAWLFATRDRLGEMSVPVMFLHAENDATTPLAGAQTLFDLVGSSAKSFWVFHGLTHIQPLFWSTHRYVSLLVTFWRDPTAQPSYTAYVTDDSIRVPDLSP